MTETQNHTLHRVISFATFFLMGVALLAFYNLIPWRVPASAASLADIAFAQCMNNTPGMLDFSCHNAGLPYGNPSTFGLPVQVLIAWLSHWFSMPLLVALRVGYGVFIAIALFGATRLFARFTQYGWIALFCGFLFVASPIVVFEGGYGPLRAAFALLPTYVLIHIKAMEAGSKSDTSGTRLCLWLAALTLTNTFAIFCDGYSFVMSLLVTGLIWGGWLLDRVKRLTARDIGISAGVLASVAIAVVAYRCYFPISTLDPMPIDFFRGQGIDTYFFVVPSDHLWLARVTGLHHHIASNQVYSDGPSSTIVYIGYGAIGCLLASLYLARKGLMPVRPYFRWIMLAGAIAFVLSLGPTLKIHDLNPSPSSGFSFSTYLMPKHHGTLNLHTSWIYQRVPGIDFMRALYRWQLVVRMVLLVSVAIVLDRLVGKRRLVLVGLISTILLFETLPAFHLVDGGGKKNFNTIKGIETSALAELRANVQEHSRTLFLQLQENPNRNEYLASYFCAAADLRCYNVGGDKGAELSSRHWPAPVYELINGLSVRENAHQVLDSGLADVIVVPMFDLRLQAYYWPDNHFPTAQTKERVKEIFGDRYSIQTTRWFAFIRPRSDVKPVQPPASPESTPAAQPIVEVLSWGPASLPPHPPPGEYIWVKVKVIPVDDLSILIDNHVLPTLKKGGDHVIAALVRDQPDSDTLRIAGGHTIYLLDRKTGARQAIGTIQIQK